MRDERGQLGGIEGVAFGVLVFVAGTLVVANAWGVVDAKLAAAAAAREAARAYVEAAPDDATSRANDAAAAALAGYGRDPRRMRLAFDTQSYGRCQRVTLTVEYPVSVGSIPLLNRPAATFTAAARHSEIIDPYRNGLPGDATCAA